MRIAFSNLAAPGWTLERTVEAVQEFGYDGLELRLLDGEPIDALEIAPSTRRAVAAALAATPLVCLDTSIELAGAFERAVSGGDRPRARVGDGQASRLRGRRSRPR